MTTALASLTTDLAAMFGVKAEATEIVETLKQTAFKSREPVSDAQLFALLVIAKQYRLNPWTREIYAYPDERKGIVPVVGVDGWIRIVNEHPQCDGWEFDHHPNNQFVTCRQFRKDRTRPLPATEFIDECLRQTDPWKKMPRRMLRHKAFIQSARLAYGFAFYDEEEGAAAAGVTIDNDTGEIVEPKRGPQRKSSAAPTPPAASAPPPQQGQGPRDPDPETGEVAPPKASPPPPQQSTDAVSAGQIAYLRKKMSAAGITESSVCERYGVAKLEDLGLDAFDEYRAELVAL